MTNPEEMRRTVSFDNPAESWNVNNTPNYRFASFQHRLGAIALDAVLMVLTLGIGWIIWSMIVWSEG